MSVAHRPISRTFWTWALLAALGACEKRAIEASPSATDPKGEGGEEIAQLVYSPVTYNFGNQALASVTDISIEVSNEGDAEATALTVGTALAAPFAFKGGAYPGTGGTCTSTLAAGATCTLVLQFSPTLPNYYSDSLELSFHDGSVTRSSGFLLKGNAGTATLAFDEAPLFTFANSLVGQSKQGTLTLSNSGNLKATNLTDSGLLVAPFQYLGGAYPGTGGTCATSLNAGADCTLVLEYLATTAGTSTSQVKLGYYTGSAIAPVLVDLSGAAGQAVLSISESPTWDFGLRYMNSSTTKSLTVTNTGDYEATDMEDAALLEAPFDYAGGSYPGTAGTCDETLAASATCTLVVEYLPTDVDEHSGSVGVAYGNGLSTVTATRALIGQSRAAVLEITGFPTYDLGPVATGTVKEVSLTVTNAGNYQATLLGSGGALAAPFRYKGTGFPGVGGTCSATLLAGLTCTVVIEYAPVGGNPATSTANLNLSYRYRETTATTNLILALNARHGLGTLAVWSSNLSFTTLAYNPATAPYRSVTLRNTGTFDITELEDGLELADPFRWRGGGSYPGSAGTCLNSLAPATNCTIQVEFDPATPDTYSDTLALTYFNGYAATSLNIPATGIGAQAVLELTSADPIDYGNQNINGGPYDLTVTVQNTGNWTSSATAASAVNLPFRYRTSSTFPGTGGNCTTTLAAGASCNLRLEYLPTAVGAHSGLVELQYNDGSGALQTLSMDIEGVGINTVPVAGNTSATLPQDEVAFPITLPTATDPNVGDTLTYTIVTPPANGTLGSDDGNTSLTYTPDVSYYGADSFTYVVNDGTGDSNLATVSLTIVQWWDSDWGSRLPITFGNAGRGVLSNFPVLVVLHSGLINYTQTQNAGQDLRFLDSDHSTVLDHEIELWNESGTSYVWVKVPQIDGASNLDKIFMYYNNSGVGDGQNAANVWSNGFLSVWHLNQVPGSLNDSVGGRHLSVGGAGGSSRTTGQIGYGTQINGNGDYLENALVAGDLSGQSAYTLSLWAKASSTGHDRGLYTSDSTGSGDDYFSLRYDSIDNGMVAGTSASGGQQDVLSAGSTQSTSWQHLAVRWNAGGDTEIFANASQSGPDAVNGASPTGTLNGLNTFRVGQGVADILAGGRSWDGALDEIRLSNVSRSNDWLDAERASMLNTLNTYGGVETPD